MGYIQTRSNLVSIVYLLVFRVRIKAMPQAHMKLHTDSYPSSGLNLAPLWCEVAIVPIVPQCHTAQSQLSHMIPATNLHKRKEWAGVNECSTIMFLYRCFKHTLCRGQYIWNCNLGKYDPYWSRWLLHKVTVFSYMIIVHLKIHWQDLNV